MASEQIEINVVVGGVSSLRDVSLALRSLTMAMDENVRSIKNMDARQRAFSQAIGVTNRETGHHAKSVAQLVRNQATLGEAVRHTTKDLTRLKQELALGRGGIGMPNLVSDLEKAQKNMQKLRARALISDLKSVSMEIRRMGKDLQFVGRSLIIGLTTPILGFASQGLSALYSLEKQLVQLRKIISETYASQGVSDDEIQGFRDFGYAVDGATSRLDAINMVLRDTSLSFGISRDALTAITADFAVLGVTASDTLAILTKTAAEVTVLGAMDLSASQELTQTLFLGMQRALDKRGEVFENAAERQARAVTLLRSQIYLFNAVENATAMSFRDVAESLPEIAAAVTEFGLTFMEGLALTAPIKAAGIQTSVAANAIKMSLQRLTAPTITARKHMEGMKEEMQGMIDNSEVLGTAFENIFGIGSVGLQALIDITQALGGVEDGAAKSMAMYSKLFDKRQSTRMKIAIDDLAAFQREMNRSGSGAQQLIDKFNNWARESEAASNATIPLINNVESLMTVAKLASASILPTEDSVMIAGREFFQRDIDAAREARKQLQEYFKGRFAEGENIIKNISQESGKVLFTQLLGAGGAVELAQAELQVALESISVAIDRVKIALKEISITFISDLKPMIESVANAMRSLGEFFANLDPAIRKSIIAFAGFAASLGPLVFILGQVKLAFGVLSGTMLRFIPGLANLTLEQVAANTGLKRLRKGLTLTGETVVNANSRFATLVATLSGGEGVVGRLANRFGLITGILKKTTTASSDVIKAVKETTIAGERALSISSAAAGVPLTPDQIRQQRLAGRPMSPTELFNRARTRMIKQEMDSESLRLAKEVTVGKTGGLVARGAGGRFAQPSADQINAWRKLDSIRTRAANEAIEATERFRQIEARQPFYERRGISADPLTGTFTRRGREITQKQADTIAFGGIRGRIAAARQRFTPTGRLATLASVPRRAVGAAVAGSRAFAADPMGVLKKVSTKPFELPLKIYRLNVKKATTAVQILTNKHAVFGKEAPNIFLRVLGSIKALLPALTSVKKALALLKIAVIKTGIGAIIVGIVAVMVIFAKNWDKIKEKAAPVMEALSYFWESLKGSITAIIRPFMEFFQVLGKGSDDGESSVNAIASVFQFLASVITKTADAISSFVNDKVVPFLRRALGAVLVFADGVKGLVKAFIAMFRGGEDATSQLKDSIQKIFQSIIEFFLGVFAPAFVDIFATAIKIASDLFLKLASFTPVVGGMIINVFSEVASGIINLIGGAISKVFSMISNIPVLGDIPGLDWLLSGASKAVGAITNALSSGVSSLGDVAFEFGSAITRNISGPLDRASDSFGNAIDSVAKKVKAELRKFAPVGTDAAGGFWGGWKDKSEKESLDITEDIVDPMVDEFGNAGGDAAEEFARKFEDSMKSLQQKFVDLVLGVLDTTIDDVTSSLVDALEKQRDSALAVFDQQIENIEKLQEAEESLMREREYLADRRRMLDERELNRQNYIRNRALAIYEGRIDDARMLDLEERKSRTDSIEDLKNLDNKRNRDLAKENIDFIKDQIKKTKEESDKFFKDQIEAFKEAAKEITKFAPQTLEEYESQLNQLTELAKKTANDNGVAFAETFEKMSQVIATELPNIGAGVFTENLQSLIDIAREKYGLESPTENSIVGATIAMLKGVSQSIQTDGVIINKSMDEILTSLKTDVVDKTLNEINTLLEENNPHKIIAEAIETANQTIIREFERTVGHVASNVDDLANSMDPFIEKIVRAQLELEALREAASKPMGDPTGGGLGGGPGLSPLGQKEKRLRELAFQLSSLKGAPRELQMRVQAEYDKLKAEVDAEKKKLDAPNLTRVPSWVETYMRQTPPVGVKGEPLPQGLVKAKLLSVITQLSNSSALGSAAMNKTVIDVRSGLTSSHIDRYVRQAANNYITNNSSRFGSLRLANGGAVPGFGSSGIPALLHGGEFVINSKAVSNIGLAALQSMNNMRFNTPGRYAGQNAPTSITETHNYNIYVDNFIGEDQWFEGMMKNYNMKVVPRNQKNAGLQSRTVSTYSGINRGM